MGPASRGELSHTGRTKRRGEAKAAGHPGITVSVPNRARRRSRDYADAAHSPVTGKERERPTDTRQVSLTIKTLHWHRDGVMGET